ncbi:uncharacterized protein EHS24_002552 [Apiotrichum porosum]|uniref:Rab-GAP TBC domain-containing protein n=1 Tax=Apiotrichum porosum TaxID=105984 RepID=A0A427XGZ8_9TREE|nr:uncharacterized protein EHS24_002552 [Apiotrichum porosum]RSH78096.1 hypothetical protein EHS24_002552 [Apiotrichum porosum]
MSTNLQDYIELLTAEQHVQVDKLRESARNGVSPRVRGHVLTLPGSVDVPPRRAQLGQDKRNDVSQDLADRIRRAPLVFAVRPAVHIAANSAGTPHASVRVADIREPDHDSHLRTELARGAMSFSPNLPPGPQGAPPPLSLEDGGMSWRGKGFLLPPPSAPPTRHAYLTLIEEVLGKYWHAAGMPDDPDPHSDLQPRPAWAPGMPPAPADWVYLATPFVCVLSRPLAVFYSFEKLVDRLSSFPPLPSRLGTILGLFRSALPDLHAYFEDEQVPMIAVAMSWMTTLLSREMWLGDVLRLWDSYLAADNMFALHCYVCVAILATCKETLEELDGSEAKLMLLDLPPMDVDRLLQDAANLKVQYSLPGPIDADDDEP